MHVQRKDFQTAATSSTFWPLWFIINIVKPFSWKQAACVYDNSYLYSLFVFLVLLGFPPQKLSWSDADSSLSSIAIRSGDTLIVEEDRTQPRVLTSPRPSPRLSATGPNSCTGKLTRKWVQGVLQWPKSLFGSWRGTPVAKVTFRKLTQNWLTKTNL